MWSTTPIWWLWCWCISAICKEKPNLFLRWLRMSTQDVIRLCQQEQSDNYIERHIIVGWQSINPSLQRWTHIWEFSGAKTVGTDLQRSGKKWFGQMSHLLLDKWSRACVFYTKRTIQTWMIGTYSEGIWWVCYGVGGILLVWFGSTCPLRVKVTANQYKVVVSDHLYPMVK